MTLTTVPLTLNYQDEAHDVVVTFSPVATCADLSSELRHEGRIELRGRVLGRDERLSAVGLLAGDLLNLVKSTAPAAPTTDAFEQAELHLLQLSGSEAGRLHALRPGCVVRVGSESWDGQGIETLLCGDPGVPALAFSIQFPAGENSPELTVTPESRVLHNGSSVIGRSQLMPGDILQVGRYLRFRVATEETADRPNSQGLIPFSPTGARPTEDPPIVVARAPRAQRILEPPDPPWTRILYPLGSAVVLLIVFQRIALIALLVAPVAIGLFDWKRMRRKTALQNQAERDRYSSEWAALKSQVSAGSKLQAEVRHRLLPKNEDLYRLAYRRQPGLWSVAAERPEFLQVRLGYGSNVAWHRLEGDFAMQEEDDVRSHMAVVDIPVIHDLASHHLALVGSLDDTSAAVSSLILQICSLFSPRNVEVLVALPRLPDFSGQMTWSKWLPHCRMNDDRLGIAVGRRRTDALVSHLAAQARSMTDEVLQDRADIILIIHEAVEPSLDSIDQLLRAAPKKVHLVWVGTSVERVPVVVDTVLRISGVDSLTAEVIASPPTWEWRRASFPIDLARGRTPELVARGLAPLYDPRAITAGSGLPGHIGLLSLVGGLSRESADKNLLVRLGMSGPSPLDVDLATGPHMLVGGTTGAGKSELLQTLVSSIVGRYSPADVHLLLVDYKGGLAFGPFRELRHVAGLVSDLTPAQADRVIAYLQYEVQRRKEVIAGADARDFQDLRTKENGLLPRLVVVFDEFAAVLTARPKFLESAVWIAQQGRALGMHLVLATQRPSGQTITADLRANIALRVALRTLEDSDSVAVLGTPLAARIPGDMRGRGFLRGVDDRIVLFQSGHASHVSNKDDAAPVRVTPFRLTESAQIRPRDDDQTGPTDLELFTATYVERDGKEPRADPALGVSLDERSVVIPKSPDGCLALGIGDDPRHQRAIDYLLQQDAPGLLIAGGLGSGKTNVLRLLAAQHKGEIVAIDGRGELSEWLRGRSGTTVAAAHDLELATLLIDQLLFRIEAGLANDVLVLVDDVGAWVAGLERLADSPVWMGALGSLAQMSRGRGVRIVATTRRPSEVPQGIRASFRDMLQLRVESEADDFTGGRAGGLPIGRAIDTRSSIQVQLYPAPDRPGKGPRHSSFGRIPPDEREFACDEVSNAGIKMAFDEHLLIVGPRGSGRTTVLRRLLATAAGQDQWEVLSGGLEFRRVGAEDVRDLESLKLLLNASLAPSTPPVLFLDGTRGLPLTTQAWLGLAAGQGLIRLLVACDVSEALASWLAVLRDEGTAMFLALRPQQSGTNPVFRVIGDLPRVRPGAKFPKGTALFCRRGEQVVVRFPPTKEEVQM